MDEDLETLQARHKKEQKALVAQTTSLKKTVTKGEKSKRKEVLAEIQRLEDDLKERHQRELSELQNKPEQTVETQENVAEKEDVVDIDGGDSDAVKGIQELSLEEPVSNGKKKPKVNRQKARMARRAAEMEEQRELAAQEASAMPDLSSQEQSAMQILFEKYNLKEESVRPDGNCLYAAFASQLNHITPHKYDYKQLRSKAASFIRQHKDDFEPFLFADEYSSAKDIESYCSEIEETSLWGGEMEITALSRAMEVPVEIYSNRSLSPLVIELNGGAAQDKGGDRDVVRLAYYQHLFGLGQHYNGLFKT